MNIKSLLNQILGRPLASSQRRKQMLSIITGLCALGLDALASTAYGPEAALMILLPLGAGGLTYFFPIIVAVVVVLFLLYLSYMQTIAAYPNGGGAYIVASDNLGTYAGVWAAVALLMDYLLNVAVGISAGIGAVVSAVPMLQPYTLTLCLLVLFMLMIINLRGIRESGLTFAIPVAIFLVCMAFMIIAGLIYTWRSGGHPIPVSSPPPFPAATSSLSFWLLLGAFANGLTAMTGVEAVSNAVPIFYKPNIKNARLTLTLIVAILGLFLLGIGYLCSAYHIAAMDEYHAHYQTILSQLVGAVAGKGIFYYISIISIFIVLTYSAQTSFAGFPRVCRLLAQDYYLPYFFAERGRRLVFSQGIILLAVFSAILLIAFDGITSNLIPLFAVGAFSAFLFSQSGMVVYWLRKKEKGSTIKLICNAVGAVTTLIALIIIIAAKFLHGAWIVVLIAPILVFILTRINHHYKKIMREVETPLKLKAKKLQPPIVIIPIRGWDRLSERAVQFGLLLSDNIYCLHIVTENEDTDELKELWKEKVEKSTKAADVAVPKLEVLQSPYRLINQPVLNYVKKIRKEYPNRLITVVIPELVEPHWYEYLLHSIQAASLRTLLFLERDHQTVVITIPWYLHEKPS